MALLAILAGHAELAAVDGDVHLRHEIFSSSMILSENRFPLFGIMLPR
jgi:hypothetical protein